MLVDSTESVRVRMGEVKSAREWANPPPRQSLRFRRSKGPRGVRIRETDGSASRQFRFSMMFAPAPCLCRRPFAGAAIDAHEAPCPALIDHRCSFGDWARVNVGTEIVAGDAVELLARQNPFSGHLLRQPQTVRNRRLGNAHRVRQFLLSSGAGDAELKRFIPGESANHALYNIRHLILVNSHLWVSTIIFVARP